MASRSAIWQRRTPARAWCIWLAWLLGMTVVYYCLTLIADHTEWFFVADAPGVAADIASRMVPPAWETLPTLMRPLWDTFNIATLGTLLAVVMALPVAFLAAANTTPSLMLVRPLALLIIVSSRSINSLIWGLLLVTILGPGVLAGVLAIALRSVGFMAKLLYEAIEEIDHRPVEALESTGASTLQVLNFGIWPQILPAFFGILVFRWDINIRESTILGLVGAGGIGLALQSAINVVAWQQVAVILLLILLTVLLSEWVSARVRHAII